MALEMQATLQPFQMGTLLYDQRWRKKVVALVKENEGQLSVIEKLDAQEVKDRAIDITNEENNYLLRTSLECDGNNCRSEEHVLTQSD